MPKKDKVATPSCFLSSKDMAAICGEDISWVHKNALALGGFNVNDTWFFTTRRLRRALHEQADHQYYQKPPITRIDPKSLNSIVEKSNIFMENKKTKRSVYIKV